MPLRFCERFIGIDSWGNPAIWRKGRAAWWVPSNGKELNKRKREHIIRNDSTIEDEDKEEEGEVKREVKREAEKKAKEGSLEVKEEPISPPPLRRRTK
jgi:hypothetical protein